MNKNKIFSWMFVLAFLVFSVCSANAQRMSSESRKKWEISSMFFTDMREGKNFSLDSKGLVVKVENKNETLILLNENELQEIDALVRNLNLSQTTTKTVIGKGVYDFPFWLFSIEIGDKYYVLDGEFFSDTKVTVLSDRQTLIFEKLKTKLEEIGALAFKNKQ